MNYIENLLNQEDITSANLSKVLETNHILMNLTDGTKQLNLLQEVIVKTIYLNKIFFLEEMVLLYSFQSCKQTIEKAVLDLQKMDYIKSQATEWGKALCLTSKGLSQLKQNPFISKSNDYITSTTNSDDFNSHMLKFKVLSAELSSTIFITLLVAIIKRFSSEERAFRKKYAKIQFIKHYLYKDFLKLSKSEKTAQLKELFTDSEVIEKYAILNLYSNTFAIHYADAYYNHYGSQSFDDIADFQVYRSYLNQHCLKHLDDATTSFHFLRDYYNSLNHNKETILNQIYQLLYQRGCNYLRMKDYSYRQLLLNRKGTTTALKAEFLLYKTNKSLQLLETKRRNLLKEYKNKADTPDDELLLINQQINQLDTAITAYQEKLNAYKQHLSFLLYDKTKDNGLDIFQETIITLDSLKQSGIYIGQIQEEVISFCIVPFDSNSFTYTSLFKKIERTFVFHHYVLPNYHLNIKICCYGIENVKEVKKLLKKVKEKFSGIKEYQLLATDFYNIVSVHNMEFHFKERFEVFPIPRDYFEKQD